jgi:hypothetical protein
MPDNQEAPTKMRRWLSKVILKRSPHAKRPVVNADDMGEPGSIGLEDMPIDRENREFTKVPYFG